MSRTCSFGQYSSSDERAMVTTKGLGKLAKSRENSPTNLSISEAVLSRWGKIKLSAALMTVSRSMSLSRQLWQNLSKIPSSSESAVLEDDQVASKRLIVLSMSER